MFSRSRFPPRESDETHSHSDMVRGLVPSMSDVSVGHSDEQVGCKGNCHSLGEWRHLVSYQVGQSRTRGHFDMTVGLVPKRSDMSASPSIIMVGCVPTWMDVSVEPFHHCGRMCSSLDGSAKIFHHCGRMCSSLDGSVETLHHCGRMCSRLDGCECCAFLTSRLDISAEEDLHGG